MKRLSRVVKFRAKDAFTKEWRYGYLSEGSHGYYIASGSTGHIWIVDADTVGQFTGLYDNVGKEIYERDVLRFDNFYGQWDAEVVFEDGVFTVKTLNVTQRKNVDTWKEKHDMVKSRGFALTIGYGENGTWNEPRKAITGLGVMFKTYEEMRPLLEKHGHGKRIINVVLMGNIVDNPELLTSYETSDKF